MVIDCSFEWNEESFGPGATYAMFFNKIKELRPDIEFRYSDSRELRAQEDGKTYFGHCCRYGPFYLMIRNVENNKYILVSYWDAIKDIFEFKQSGFDLGLMAEIITSSGIIQNDIEYIEIPYLKYTPFGYTPLSPENEKAIEILYAKNADKTIPDKPRFRNFPNDPFRQYLHTDDRFDCIDRREFNINKEEYMAELNLHKINLSVNGHGEVCNRDMEIMGLGNVLLRTKFVAQFHEPLIPDVHYVAVDFDDYKDYKTTADKLIAKYNEIKDNKDFLDYVGKNAREWYLRNGCTKGNAELLTKIVNFNKLK